ncbi:Phospholipid-transporting ATPase [Paramicrosporidium saccamoebae]|uniref:Phospholipid-transporting ATPase n=1 Tax=Paramicrosporidium saccamoebae TaxID=1246581 RepID=A0A2H9TMI1_9FUNG|nr:Phospholipid-transporting ATPase [Paramicrosporidium saccamoebae]
MPPNSRRYQSPSTLFRRKTRKEGKLRRWKSAASNWLNGLPVTQEDFDSSSIQQELHSSTRARRSTRASIKHHLKPKNWFRSRDNSIESDLAMAGTPGPQPNLEDKKEDESVNLVLQEPPVDERPPVRIIQLPPEPLAHVPLANKKDDIHSTMVTNEIRTAKYTMLNFLPKNILEQMRRVANIYFVFIVFLQCFPAVSNYNPVLAAAPIVIIMVVTAIKDAVEDWKRHKQDNEVNYSIALTLNRPDGGAIVQRDTRYQRFANRMIHWRDMTIRAVQILYGKIKRTPVPVSGRHQKLEKLPEGQVNWKQTFWRDMRVGDIVLLRNNEMIPADVMILSTSEPDGICFVETKNLDGETNLKIRRCLYETEWIKRPEDAYNMKATIEVDLPNNNLYLFNGRIIFSKEIPSPIKQQEMEEAEEFSGIPALEDDIDGKAIITRSESAFVEPAVLPVSHEGLLLRGCILRNTGYVIGVVVYTGPHTKLMLNSGGTPSKRTRIERQMNPQIILNFILLFIICVSCAIVQSQFSASADTAPFWVSGFDSGLLTSPAFLGFLTFWSSLILFQTLVPISMYVVVEIVKTVQVSIHYDLPCQIEYLFSDKTGTLTQNVMEFRRCSIGGQVYGTLTPSEPGEAVELSRSSSATMRAAESGKWTTAESEMVTSLQQMLTYPYVPPSKFSFVDEHLFTSIREDAEQREKIFSFFLLLTVCHTVLIDRPVDSEEEEDFVKKSDDFKPHNLLFKAQSPDEAALVSAARDLGFVFLGRDKDFIFVSNLGEIETITVLNVLEFSSDRKRMSTIVRRQNGEIVLMCKGADNIIFERLSQDSLESQVAQLTQNHLENFAEEASAAMHNRELFMDAASDEIERDLTLLGATAIEDKLQEGVPECIEMLQMAGIKVWVLTGDKMETAINIGFSCRLLNKNMVLLVIRGSDEEETLKQLRSAYEKIWSRYFSFGDTSGEQIASNATSSFAMIIEGKTLKFALEKSCRKIFVNLSSRCDAVICCRVSPLQKAKVVELIRHGKNVMTMAIGDGANDVSMIQAADVGVGIAGQEGMQAVMSSDYAIAQFRYLTRLLLVHGRWSYIRVAEVTLLSLYKNLAFVVLLFWYQFYCGFTAQYVYDYMFLLFFNIVFSILPLLILGSFDRDLTDKYLLSVAPIYQQGIRQTSYSMKLFIFYLIDALYQSIVCFFIPMLAYSDTAITYSGQTENQTLLGNVMALSIITCTNMYMAINTFSWVAAMFIGLAITIIAVFGFVLVYSLIPMQNLYGSWRNFLDPIFWATIVLSIVISQMPRLLAKYVQTIWRPGDLDIVREITKWGFGQADLWRSLIPIHATMPRLGEVQLEDVIKAPEKAMIRTEPRRILGMELADEIPIEMEKGKCIEVIEEKPRHRFLRRSLGMFNLRTGRFERMTGFAFSQEDGMGEVVTHNRPRPTKAFGAVFLGDSQAENLRRVSQIPPVSMGSFTLPTPTVPIAAARRETSRRSNRNSFSLHFPRFSVAKER